MRAKDRDHKIGEIATTQVEISDNSKIIQAAEVDTDKILEGAQEVLKDLIAHPPEIANKPKRIINLIKEHIIPNQKRSRPTGTK